MDQLESKEVKTVEKAWPQNAVISSFVFLSPTILLLYRIDIHEWSIIRISTTAVVGWLGRTLYHPLVLHHDIKDEEEALENARIVVNDGDYDLKEDEEQGFADEEADNEYLCELEETESLSDDDYDPNDGKEQGIKDGEDDSLESQESECTEKSDDIFAELKNEEKLVNLDEVAKEFDLAINNVLEIAKIERERILTNAEATYKEFTGEEAIDDIIIDAFRVFSIDCEIETETDEQYIDVDPDEYRVEFEKALDNVSVVAKVDQQRLYDTICDISDFYGIETDAKQILQIFGRIKEEFADEAHQEFLDLNEVIDDEEDLKRFNIEKTNKVMQTLILVHQEYCKNLCVDNLRCSRSVGTSLRVLQHIISVHDVCDDIEQIEEESEEKNESELTRSGIIYVLEKHHGIINLFFQKLLSYMKKKEEGCRVIGNFRVRFDFLRFILEFSSLRLFVKQSDDLWDIVIGDTLNYQYICVGIETDAFGVCVINSVYIRYNLITKVLLCRMSKIEDDDIVLNTIDGQSSLSSEIEQEKQTKSVFEQNIFDLKDLQNKMRSMTENEKRLKEELELYKIMSNKHEVTLNKISTLEEILLDHLLRIMLIHEAEGIMLYERQSLILNERIFEVWTPQLENNIELMMLKIKLLMVTLSTLTQILRLVRDDLISILLRAAVSYNRCGLLIHALESVETMSNIFEDKVENNQYCSRKSMNTECIQECDAKIYCVAILRGLCIVEVLRLKIINKGVLCSFVQICGFDSVHKQTQTEFLLSSFSRMFKKITSNEYLLQKSVERAIVEHLLSDISDWASYRYSRMIMNTLSIVFESYKSMWNKQFKLFEVQINLYLNAQSIFNIMKVSLEIKIVLLQKEYKDNVKDRVKTFNKLSLHKRRIQSKIKSDLNELKDIKRVYPINKKVLHPSEIEKKLEKYRKTIRCLESRRKVVKHRVPTVIEDNKSMSYHNMVNVNKQDEMKADLDKNVKQYVKNMENMVKKHVQIEEDEESESESSSCYYSDDELYYIVKKRYKLGLILLLFISGLYIYFAHYCSVVSIGNQNIELLSSNINWGQIQIDMDHVDANSHHYFGGSQYIVNMEHIPDSDESMYLFDRRLLGLTHCHLNKMSHRDLQSINLVNKQMQYRGDVIKVQQNYFFDYSSNIIYDVGIASAEYTGRYFKDLKERINEAKRQQQKSQDGYSCYDYGYEYNSNYNNRLLEYELKRVDFNCDMRLIGDGILNQFCKETKILQEFVECECIIELIECIWRLHLRDALKYLRKGGRGRFGFDGRILAEIKFEVFYKLNVAEVNLDKLITIFIRIKGELEEDIFEYREGIVYCSFFNLVLNNTESMYCSQSGSGSQNTIELLSSNTFIPSIKTHELVKWAQPQDTDNELLIPGTLKNKVLAFNIESWSSMLIPLLAFGAFICVSFFVMRPFAEHILKVNLFCPSMMMSVTIAMCIEYLLILLSRYREEVERNSKGLHQNKQRMIEISCEAVRQTTRWSGIVIDLTGCILSLKYLVLTFYPMEVSQSVDLSTGDCNKSCFGDLDYSEEETVVKRDEYEETISSRIISLHWKFIIIMILNAIMLFKELIKEDIFCGLKTIIIPWSILISIVLYNAIATIEWQFTTFNQQLADISMFYGNSEYYTINTNIVDEFSAGFIIPWYTLIFKKDNQSQIFSFEVVTYLIDNERYLYITSILEIDEETDEEDEEVLRESICNTNEDVTRSVFNTVSSIIGSLSFFIPWLVMVNIGYGDYSFSFVWLISVWIILSIGCGDMFVFTLSHESQSNLLWGMKSSHHIEFEQTKDDFVDLSAYICHLKEYRIYLCLLLRQQNTGEKRNIEEMEERRERNVILIFVVCFF